MTEPRQTQAIDTAYAAASEALSDDAARRRRRAALLLALDESGASQAEVNAAQPIRPSALVRRRSNGWNMLAAACVIGLSSLLVLRMNDVAAPGDQPSRTVAAEAAADQSSGEAENARPAAPMAAAKAEPDIPQTPQIRQSQPTAEAQRRDAPRQAHRNASPPEAKANAGPANEAALAAPPEVLMKAPPQAFPAEPAKAPRQAVDRAAGRSARAVADAMPSPSQESRPQSRNDQGEIAAAAPFSSPARPSLESAKVSPPSSPGLRSTGLVAAVEAGDLAQIEQQLKTIAADAEKDAKGRTALAHAVLQVNLQAVQLLLAAGADPRLPDRAGLSPLDHAAALGDRAILAALDKRR